MAAIPGHIRDEIVIIGNHRDGAQRCPDDPYRPLNLQQLG